MPEIGRAGVEILTLRASANDPVHAIEGAERWRGASRDPREQAVNQYRAVRDEIRYNPYVFSADHQTLKASHALAPCSR